METLKKEIKVILASEDKREDLVRGFGCNPGLANREVTKELLRWFLRKLEKY